jgi:hypothetical protein
VFLCLYVSVCLYVVYRTPYGRKPPFSHARHRIAHKKDVLMYHATGTVSFKSVSLLLLSSTRGMAHL